MAFQNHSFIGVSHITYFHFSFSFSTNMIWHMFISFALNAKNGIKQYKIILWHNILWHCTYCIQWVCTMELDTVLILPSWVLFAGVRLIMLYAEVVYWLISFWEFVSRAIFISWRNGEGRPMFSSQRYGWMNFYDYNNCYIHNSGLLVKYKDWFLFVYAMLYVDSCSLGT